VAAPGRGLQESQKLALAAWRCWERQRLQQAKATRLRLQPEVALAQARQHAELQA
jgi:hypothetical protein